MLVKDGYICAKVLLKTDKEPLMGPNYGVLQLWVVAKSEFNSNKISDELHAIYMLTIKGKGLCAGF